MATTQGRRNAVRTSDVSLGICAAAFAAIVLLSGPALAYDVTIDNFKVIENYGTGDVTIFNDAFSSGTPSSPTYGSTNGTFLGGAGSVEMTTANGDSNIFGGTQFIHHDAILPITVASKYDLTSTDTFAVEGLFDLSIPTDLRESYGVLLTDRTATNDGNDQLEMRVLRTATNHLRIEFQRVTYNPDTTTHIDAIALGAVAGIDLSSTTDKILLRLEKKSATSNAITASYEYFSDAAAANDYLANGPGSGLTEFATTADIFHPASEDYTRAGFYARVAMAVPAPASLMLFGLGLAGLGIMRRRRPA